MALFVGIDVSKDYSSAQGLDRQGKKLFYIEFSTDGEGFSRFLSMVNKHCAHPSEVTAGMESTGCYHVNLFAFLCAKGISCVVINPLLIANFARLSLRKTKTDKKDASTIAQFLLAHQEVLPKVTFSQSGQDLQGPCEGARILDRDDCWIEERYSENPPDDLSGTGASV